MFDLVLPYLGAIVATLILAIIAVAVFFVSRRAAVHYEQLAARLPDACRYLDLNHRIDDLQQQCDELQGDLAEARYILAQRDDATRELEEIREQLVGLEADRAQVAQLRHERDELTHKIAEENERHLKLIQEAERFRLQVDEFKEKKEQLAMSIAQAEKEFSNLKETLQSVESEIAAKRAELAGIEKEIEAQRIRAKEAKAECDKIIEKLEQQISEAQGHRDDLQKQAEQLRREISDLEQRRSLLSDERATIEQEMVDLRSHRKAAQRKLSERREEIEAQRLGDEMTDLEAKNRTAELWKPLFDRAHFSFDEHEDEREKIEDVQNYLEGHGLQFSDRAIYAFHTCLKIADVSPLVVLAGISGTGKSELPRRYSEAMGMHFLNIAVQPRWDSPQDMFGFYNYLEKRYRATELARALMQMDRYFNPHTASEKERGKESPEDWGDESLSDQMLIVLLDEMNLARIEYYFSEFLSRLEIRRGIGDPNDHFDRRKAEVPLEIGNVGKGDSVVRLFVDTNVLFVGTMNEDETTQTLSDKVVDRANVIRFGRPKRLDSNGVGHPLLPPSTRLPYEVWKSWLREETLFEGAMSEEVNQWIVRLNEAMARIGRPFAHRTRLAIRTYVANYPDFAGDYYANAMADQIEQKILPKFRGLDPTDNQVRIALGEIRSVLEDLHDELLIEALNQSSREHLFQWMGVDRQSQEVIAP